MLEYRLTGETASPVAPERAALYREIFAHATDGIAIIDPQGHYLEQNAAHQVLTGYSPAELRGQTPAVHLGEAAFAQIVRELQRTGRYHGEHESRAKDGTRRVVELSAFEVRDEQGEVRYYVGAKHDVTQRRQSEATLERRFDQLHAIYEMTTLVSRASALDEIYEVGLSCLETTLGADRTSVLLFDEHNVMRFQAWHGLSAEYRRAVEGHSPWPADDADPQPVTIPDVVVAPELGELRAVIQAEGIGAVAFIPLVFQQRLLGKFMLYFNAPHTFVPEELQLAQTVANQIAFSIVRQKNEDELKAANAAKSAFLATMSHELRTPLNAILGYSDLLTLGITGGLNATQNAHIDRIRTSALHLMKVIEEILTFSRAGAGKEELNISALPLDAFTVETAALVEPIALEKRLALRVEKPAPLGVITTDERMLRQVLLNLLSNAVKFTDQGEVVLRGERTASGVRITVTDTGCGIDPAHHRRIFEPFWQADRGSRRRAGGTGLGLTVTAQLVELLGGRISLDSRLGEGARFVLELPAAHALSTNGAGARVTAP